MAHITASRQNACGNAVDEERKNIDEESKNVLKWLVQTMCDSKCIDSLFSCTCLISHHAFYTYERYDFAASNMCDDEEPVSLDEGHDSKN